MTTPGSPAPEACIIGGLATVLLAAGLLRVAVAVAAGIKALTRHGTYPDATTHAAGTLIYLGGAGDLAGALLAVVVVGLLWWRFRLGESWHGGLRTVTGGLLLLTVLSALTEGAGYGIGFAQTHPVQTEELLRTCGFALAAAVVAAGGLVAMSRLDPIGDEASAGDVDDIDAMVFAVDRSNGDVHAYLSLNEAARRTNAYSVEDNEFAFFTDDGDVLAASVEHGRVLLRATDINRRDELLTRLGEFVSRKDIGIDMRDVDDPSAYAGPISDWQALQLWPGWLRWMGRLVRPR